MKHSVFGKRKIVFAVLILIWAAVLITVFILTAVERANAEARRLPVYSAAREDKAIALTFNAAWGNETTDAVLSCLREHNIRATFFIVGDFAEQYPGSVKKIFAEGHELGNHSMRHLDPVTQDTPALLADITACNDRLRRLTGVSPTLYRAPSGSYNDQTIDAAESLGMTVIQWSADSIDWKDPSPETIVSRILKKTTPGGILLFHLGKENTAAALPEVIRRLREAGYSFVTVSELLPQGKFCVDPYGAVRPAE